MQRPWTSIYSGTQVILEMFAASASGAISTPGPGSVGCGWCAVVAGMMMMMGRRRAGSNGAGNAVNVLAVAGAVTVTVGRLG